jgi:hypothetical protein
MKEYYKANRERIRALQEIYRNETNKFNMKHGIVKEV